MKSKHVRVVRKPRSRKAAPLPTLAGVLRWLAAHSMSMRQLALGIGRHPSLVWRVLRKEAVSKPILSDVGAFMLNPRGFRLNRTRALNRRIAQTHRVIQEIKREARRRRRSA